MAIKDVILGYAKGDKGDRGPQGEKGATGATGPKGEPGNIADAQITDTEGLDVAKGQKTTAQKLFDAIANRIVTKLVTNDALTKKLADYMLKGMMSNTNVNNTGTVPTSALMYSMFEQINSDLANKTKSGSATISTKQNDSTALQIQFDEPFPSRPYVTVSLNTDNANTNTKISVFGIDQTGFKVSIYDTAATTRRIEWIASV